MTDLKPCPFCGGEAEVTCAGRGRYQAQARCTQCHCELGEWFISKQAAAHAWNTRAERTCKPTEENYCQCGQDLVLFDMGIGPNGGAVELDPPMLFNYCPNCGAHVIKSDQYL